MSFRDKLESKIAGAVQKFVAPPEFTLPDILFDRLLSTENAEKEEESYYDDISPSDSSKEGGEKRAAREKNAPTSEKDKHTLQNKSKEIKIKGAIRRHFILSRDFVLSLKNAKIYYKNLGTLFKNYIDIITNEYYKKANSLTDRIKDTAKKIDEEIENSIDKSFDKAADKTKRRREFCRIIDKCFFNYKKFYKACKKY